MRRTKCYPPPMPAIDQEKKLLRTRLSLSTELDLIARLAANGPVEIGLVVREIGLRGHAIVSFILVLPFLQPIPLPGVSSVIGLMISILGMFLALNISPVIPQRFAQRQVSRQNLIRIAETGHRYLLMVERFIKPRGLKFQSNPIARILWALVIAVCGLLLALPLPIPFSNAIPAWTIALISLGIIERDGVLLILGCGLFLITLLFFAAIVVLPYLGFQNSSQIIKGLSL